MEPLVSVVVVTRNEELYIGDCLESLMRLDYPKDWYEVIVIDGNSSDQTQEIVNKYPVKLIIDKQGGLSHSRNLGISVATGNLIASTDADCVVHKDWLKRLVDAFHRADENTVATGGPNLVLQQDLPFAKIIGHMQESLLGSGGAPQSYKITEEKYVYGIPNCNVMYKRTILIQEGCFDENYNMGEDAELNHRLTKKGYKYLYIPNAIVYHHRPNNFRAFVKKMYTYGKGMAILTRRGKIFRIYSFIPSLCILSLVVMYPISARFSEVQIVYAFLMGVYIIGILKATYHVYRNYPHVQSLMSFFLLPIQHVTYGLGFIYGFAGGK